MIRHNRTEVGGTLCRAEGFGSIDSPCRNKAQAYRGYCRDVLAMTKVVTDKVHTHDQTPPLLLLAPPQIFIHCITIVKSSLVHDFLNLGFLSPDGFDALRD